MIGAEAWYPADEKARKEFLETFQKYRLKFGLLFGTWPIQHYQKHLQQFKSTLEAAA